MNIGLLFLLLPQGQELISPQKVLSDLDPLTSKKITAEALPELVSGALDWALWDMGIHQSVDEYEPTVLFERLLPYLRAEHAQRIGAALSEDAAINRRWILNLLLQMRSSYATNTLHQLALDENLSGGERVSILGRLLDKEGRTTLQKLRPALLQSGDEGLVRLVFHRWMRDIRNEDLVELEKLARTGEDLIREFALQLWSSGETRSEKRLEIFKLALESEQSFRVMALRALARGGRDPILAKRLQAMLDSGRREQRRLAMELLPIFGHPKTLAEEYQARKAGNRFFLPEEDWVFRLSRQTPLEVRNIGLEWVVDGGWQNAKITDRILRALENPPLPEDTIGSFLRLSEVDLKLRFRAATRWASFSTFSQDFLRRHLFANTGLRLEQAVRELAKLTKTEDSLLLREIAEGSEFDGMARVAAIRGLVKHPAGLAHLALLANNPPKEYAPAEALIWSLIVQPDVSLRKRGLEIAAAGDGFDESEKIGLARVAWIAQSQNPISSEAASLHQKLLARLMAKTGCHKKEPWPDPSRLLSDHPEIWQLTQAWISAAETPTATHFAMARACQLMVIANAVENQNPSMAAQLSMMAWKKSHLKSQLRCLGAAARYFAKAGDYQQSALAFGHLMDTPKEVVLSSRQELGFGLRTASASGWTAPRDEIHQRWLIARAGSKKSALATLPRDLEYSRCTPELYLTAIDLAHSKGQVEVADALWSRAWDYYPSSPLLKDQGETEER